jgi:hypothetical protein
MNIGNKNSFYSVLGVSGVLLIGMLAVTSCGHRRQLPPGAIREATTTDEPEAVPVQPEKPRIAGLKGYDSLKQCYDSLDVRYKASELAGDRLQTRVSQLDTALRRKERELAQLKNSTGAVVDGSHQQTISASKAKLQEELKEVKAANQTLTELGSVLHIANLKVMPIHISANGKRVKATNKAKRTNDLQILFDIDANYVAGKGEKSVFLVITDPNGKLQKVEDWTSGSFRNFNGEKLAYTLEKKVTMKENEPLKYVMINCRLGHLDQRGKFRFSLYQNGYLIGEKSLRLD